MLPAMEPLPVAALPPCGAAPYAQELAIPSNREMSYRNTAALSLLIWLLAPTAVLSATQRAVVISDQRLYREARLDSKTVGRVMAGEEATVTGRQGALLEVSLPGNRAGWTLANGVVVLDDNPRAAALLFEAADTLAQQDSVQAWGCAARLFRKAASLVPGGPYAPEALSRAAELAWRMEIRTSGAVHEAGAVKELEAVVRAHPKTAAAARAAYFLLKSNLCEFWEGTPGCPEAESSLISRYLQEYPHSPQDAELRYALAYRHSALVEIYLDKEKTHFSPEKAVEQKAKAREVVGALHREHPGSIWAARGERLLWSLDNNIGVYSGIELALRRF